MVRVSGRRVYAYVWRSEVSLGCCSSGATILVFGDRVCLWDLGCSFRLGLLSREPLASPWLCLQHVLIGSCYHSKLSVQVQSTEVRLRFTRLTHYQLSYCLSPIFLVFGPSSEAAIALKIGTSFHFVRVFNLFYVYLLWLTLKKEFFLLLSSNIQCSNPNFF